ncbi:MAG: efflux RND transporter periplasmic adaptor subunit [Halieaceae bacterium]
MSSPAKAIALACLLTQLAACDSATDSDNEAQAEVAVRVTAQLPDSRDIDYVLSALGSIESISSPTLSAETAGRITEVLVDVGMTVQPGQLLAQIDDTLHKIQAEEAEAELQRLAVMVENQSSEVQRLQRLASSQSVSKDQLEDQQDQLRMMTAQKLVAKKRWEHAEQLTMMTAVRAPHAGSIAQRHISLGDYVSPGQPLFDLVATERLRARLAFPEQDASSITRGLKVQLRSPAVPGEAAIGTVSQVNPRVQVANRSVEILVEFDNPGGWYPGGSVDAELIVSSRVNAITVPRMAVVMRDNKEIVFVAGKDDRAVARPVTLGWQEPGWIEITSGLLPSDRIIIEGAAMIKDGSAVSLSDTIE